MSASRNSVDAKGRKAVTASFWDKRAARYNMAVGKHDAVYKKTVDATRALLSETDNVLDFGCASGEFGADIAPSVRQVHGIDTSPKMLALAVEKTRSRGLNNVLFDDTDLFDRSLDGNRYTAVLAFSILHLVDDIHSALRRMYELLPRGGLLISETPCLSERGVLFRLFVNVAQLLKIAPPILNLTISGLETAVTRAGFDIVDSKAWDPKNGVHWITARKK